MGVSDWLGLGKAVSEPIKAVGDLYTTDKAKIEAETKFEEVQQKRQLAQIDLIKVFAASARFFNSGWMPLLGWSSGFLIFVYYFPQILIITYVWGKACINNGYCEQFPMKPDNLMSLVYLIITGGIHHIGNKIIKS